MFLTLGVPLRCIALVVVVFCLSSQGCEDEDEFEELPALYSSFYIEEEISRSGDSIRLHIPNPLPGPLRVFIRASETPAVTDLRRRVGTIQLAPLQDTILILRSAARPEDVRLGATLGDPEEEVNKVPLRYPFPPGRSYSIIQGYDGTFSHNSDYSRYALDFGLAVGDTVTAADSGFVVGLIRDYDEGGNSRTYRNRANFITLYHPHSGLFTQYVHLRHAGVLVELGDRVERGQPIGISGQTGFTSVPHLHFNVLWATADYVAATPITFEDGRAGSALGRGDRVSH